MFARARRGAGLKVKSDPTTRWNSLGLQVRWQEVHMDIAAQRPKGKLLQCGVVPSPIRPVGFVDSEIRGSDFTAVS
jgi:hypothetical protein